MTQITASWNHLRIEEASTERAMLVVVVDRVSETYKKEIHVQ